MTQSVAKTEKFGIARTGSKIVPKVGRGDQIYEERSARGTANGKTACAGTGGFPGKRGDKCGRSVHVVARKGIRFLLQ